MLVRPSIGERTWVNSRLSLAVSREAWFASKVALAWAPIRRLGFVNLEEKSLLFLQIVGPSEITLGQPPAVLAPERHLPGPDRALPGMDADQSQKAYPQP